MNLDLMSSCPPLKGFELILVNQVLDKKLKFWRISLYLIFETYLRVMSLNQVLDSQSFVLLEDPATGRLIYHNCEQLSKVDLRCGSWWVLWSSELLLVFLGKKGEYIHLFLFRSTRGRPKMETRIIYFPQYVLVVPWTPLLKRGSFETLKLVPSGNDLGAFDFWCDALFY